MSDSFQEMRTTESLRVISSSRSYEEDVYDNYQDMIVRPIPKVSPAWGRRHDVSVIPAGSWVTVLHYDLNVGRPSNATIRWEGVEYEVEASRDSFEDPSESHYQPIETFQKGKLYRFKLAGPSDLLNNGKKIGVINPDDIVMFLKAYPWRNGRREHGYMFEVIHQDAVGIVGSGCWATLEDLRDV